MEPDSHIYNETVDEEEHIQNYSKKTDKQRDYLTIFKNIPSPIHIWKVNDESIIFHDFNKAADKLADNSLHILVGKPAKEVFKERPTILKSLRRCANEKKTIDLEMDYKFVATGKKFNLKINLVYVAPDIIIGYHEDITKRKIAQKKLRKSEKKLSSVIEHSPVAIGIFDEDGTLIDCNKSMEKITGFKKQELIEENYKNFHIYPKGLLSVIQKGFKSSLTGKDPNPIEIQIKKKDNTHFWVIFQISSFKTEGKTFYQWIMQDINELKQTKEELTQSKEEHKNIIDNLSDIVIKVTIEGKVLYVSPQVEKLLGYTQQDFTGSQVFEYLHPDEIERYKEAFQKALTTGDLISIKLRILKRDGKYLPVNAKGNLINDQGRLRLIGIVRDLSREEKAKEKIQRRLEFERLISKISSRFVGIIDFNEVIDLTLKDMAQFINASKGYLFLFDENKDYMNNTHEWCAEGVKPQINELQEIPIQTLKWWIKQLKLNSLIHITKPDDLKIFPSEESNQDEERIKSILAFPIFIKDELMGFLGFDDVKATQDWDLDDLELFRIPSELMGNILERKFAEETLKSSENLLRGIISTIPEYLSIVDPNFNVIWVNKQIKTLIKTNPVGKKCYKVYHNRSEVCENCILSKTLEDGNSHQKEISYPVEGTQKIFLNTSRVLSKNSDDSPELLLITAQDITSLRESKQQLEINEKKYRNLFNNARHPVLLVNAKEGIIVDHNEMTEKISGYSSEEISNKSVNEIIKIEGSEKKRYINNILNKGSDTFKAFLITKDNREKEAIVIGELLNIKKEPFIQVVISFTDSASNNNFEKYL
ncbi:MAG: hypothetical protein BAJALOKI2v1_1060002 [Promethearchaeota archaeon]|nr:MAG: hypothetical protein BAJALOKI2v1_1060002 [Candidatus Lokiarchaeota archaeon]